ncbi:hypothetical protein RND71_022511 [Anisodus tanguticus]|uniref:Uncharacterized protein n=1 Tax=Anisodus tanguticus TaxID=243964 RepID=A0AAE1RTT0_9SOLA|nr:hypothetical protein RND71_022511 [Anisodus tanguticus]
MDTVSLKCILESAGRLHNGPGDCTDVSLFPWAPNHTSRYSFLVQSAKVYHNTSQSVPQKVRCTGLPKLHPRHSRIIPYASNVGVGSGSFEESQGNVSVDQPSTDGSSKIFQLVSEFL